MYQKCRRTAQRSLYVTDDAPAPRVQYAASHYRPQFQNAYQSPQYQSSYQPPKPPAIHGYKRPVYYRPQINYQPAVLTQPTYQQAAQPKFPATWRQSPQQTKYQRANQPGYSDYAPNPQYNPSPGYQYSQTRRPKSPYTLPRAYSPPRRTQYSAQRELPHNPATPMRGRQYSPTGRSYTSQSLFSQPSEQMPNRQQQLYEPEPVPQRRQTDIPAHLLSIPPRHQPPVDPAVYGGEDENVRVDFTGIIPNTYGGKKEYESVWAYRSDAARTYNPIKEDQDLHYYMYDNPTQGRINPKPLYKALDFDRNPMKRTFPVKYTKPRNIARYPRTMQRPQGSAGEIFPDFRLEVAAVNSRRLDRQRFNQNIAMRSKRPSPNMDAMGLGWSL